VVKLSSLGDVLLLTPALRAVRRHWPGAAITFLTGRAAAPLVAGNPEIDRLLVHAGGPVSFLRVVRELRRQHFDLVLDFQGLTRSWLFLRLSRAAFRAGKGRFPGLDLRAPHRRSRVRHAVESYFELTDELGIPRPVPEMLQPVFHPAKDLPLAAGAPARYVLCNPFTRGRKKRWPEVAWSKIGKELAAEGFVPVFAGAQGDKKASQRLAAGCGGKSIAGIVDLTGLASWIRGAVLTVTVDSAPLHLACAMAAPVLGIFGPTDPARTGPRGRGGRTVGRLPGTRSRKMRTISVDEVLQAVRAALSGGT
jgi:ADP-heptose:LPS heptosyltransferase